MLGYTFLAVKGLFVKGCCALSCETIKASLRRKNFPMRPKEFAMNIGLLFILPLTYAFFVYVSKHVCLHIAEVS